MRQQDPQYLLIGGGRVARHMARYFDLLDIPYMQWNRPMAASVLQDMSARAAYILVLISDDAIESFIADHLVTAPGKIIHFSGALATPAAIGMHPLMTFGDQLYDLNKYKKITFVTDSDEFLPDLPNPHVRLDPKKKAKYHALCVMAGNFSCLLWQKLFSTFEKEFNFPPEIAHLYLRQQTENIAADYKHALTGPLARGDQKTISKNLEAMEGDPYQGVYQSFVNAYSKENAA